jgi:hypothetical protein
VALRLKEARFSLNRARGRDVTSGSLCLDKCKKSLLGKQVDFDHGGSSKEARYAIF